MIKNLSRSFIILLVLSFPISLIAQKYNPTAITEMEWGLNYKLFLKLENDSNYILDVRELFHSTTSSEGNFTTEFIYYPANLGSDYVSNVKNNETEQESHLNKEHKTLWSALHESLGGGWVHFTNCLVYAFETGNLKLTSPLMERPDSEWKPKPVTESYKRTKKWDYYAPVTQKNAIKEYKKKQSNNELADIKSVPDSYIELFMETNDRDLEEFKEEEKIKELAKINLIKLLLGANYLSQPQIDYVRSAVLKSVKEYTVNKLPSVVIFDEFDAAAAMSLDAKGYNIEMIVFDSEANLSEEEQIQRTSEIEKIIARINDYNQQSFKKRLNIYYQ